MTTKKNNESTQNTAVISFTGINYTTLKNSKLVTNLKVMEKEVLTANKASWRFAIAFNRIKTLELYKEDFASIAELCRQIGISESTASQYCKGVQFLMKQGVIDKITGKILTEDGNIVGGVGNAYLLSTMKDDELEKFTDECKKSGIDNPSALTQKSLRDVMNNFKKGRPLLAEKEKKALPDKKAEEAKEEVIDSKEKALAYIKRLMAVFEINKEELN